MTVQKKLVLVDESFIAIPWCLLSLDCYVALELFSLQTKYLSWLYHQKILNCMPFCTTKQLANSPIKVIPLHAKGCFIIRTIFMDSEFEKLISEVPHTMINITATNEHFGEIEHKVQVINK